MGPLTQPPLAENDVRTFNDGGYFFYHGKFSPTIN